MFWKAIGVLFFLGVVGAAWGGVDTGDSPTPSGSTVAVTAGPVDSTPPPSDLVWGGSNSVRSVIAPSTSPTVSVVSGSVSGGDIDCENAEQLADSGEYEASDIADYCDYGPDDGSELPDEFDWDK